MKHTHATPTSKSNHSASLLLPIYAYSTTADSFGMAAEFGAFRFIPANMIEVVLNDRLGRKIRVKCNPSDTIGDLKKLVAAQTGTLSLYLVRM